MKNKIQSIALFGLIFIILCFPVYGQTTSRFISTAGGSNQYVSYTGSSSSVGNYYQDLGSNPDVGIELCGQGADKYVAGVYGANVSGSIIAVPVTYKVGGSDGLAAADTVSGSCRWTQAGFLTVSPSYLGTKTPIIYTAAFPGRLWTMYSTSGTGTSPNYVFMNTASWLRGSYGVSGTFDENTKNITFSSPTVHFTDTGGASISKALTNPTFGVSSTRMMVWAVCDDIYGQTCSDGTIVNSTSQISSGVELATGISPLLDSINYTKYLVLNGIGTLKCIGPKTDIVDLSVSPAGGPQGTKVNLTVQVNNTGDVSINSTHSFNVSFWKTLPLPEQYIGDLTITGLDVGQTKSVTWTNYDTTGLTSQPTFKVNLSDSTYSVGSCGGTKSDTQIFSWVTYVLPTVLIDGVQTDNFTCAGRPQNVTIYLNDSNNNVLSNTWIYFYEINGISPFAATQVYSAAGGQRYIKSVNRGDIQTDSNGMVQFSLIPTGNKLLGDAAYSYLNLSSTIGSYQLYFTTSNSNQIYQGSAKSQYDLGLNSLTLCSPNSSERYSLTVNNQDTYVKTVLTFVYQTFATARTWLTP